MGHTRVLSCDPSGRPNCAITCSHACLHTCRSNNHVLAASTYTTPQCTTVQNRLLQTCTIISATTTHAPYKPYNTHTNEQTKLKNCGSFTYFFQCSTLKAEQKLLSLHVGCSFFLECRMNESHGEIDHFSCLAELGSIHFALCRLPPVEFYCSCSQKAGTMGLTGSGEAVLKDVGVYFYW